MISFRVPGIPQPQGSHKAFVNRKTGRAIITQDNTRLRSWRSEVAWCAAQAAGATTAMLGPVRVYLVFWLPRPKAHYKANGSLKSDAPRYCPKRPDVDKLCRAVLDALTESGIVRDDGQVADLRAIKMYADHAPETVVEVDDIK